MVNPVLANMGFWLSEIVISVVKPTQMLRKNLGSNFNNGKFPKDSRRK
jgi:hypothetical protein